MTEKQANKTQQRDADRAPGSTNPGVSPPPLPPPETHPPCDPHCVDVTGKVPEDIRIDPDITEGHPGYQESGDSEIIPLDRLAGGKGPEEKNG